MELTGPMDADSLTLGKIRACVLIAKGLPILNISQTGLAVQTEKPLTMGESYYLQLHSEGQTLCLEGYVARCNLAELSASATGETTPMYLNGLQFQMSRNPLEKSLIDLIFENTIGEKRRGGQRIQPSHRMTLDIGRPYFTRVKQIDAHGILLHSVALIDLDRPWNLLIQVEDHGMVIPARVLHASKKEGASDFAIRLEYLHPDAKQRAFLDHIVQLLDPTTEA